MGDEVEPGAANAGVVQRADAAVVERIVEHRHPGAATPPTHQGVDHRRVVGAVTARLDEHRPGESDAFVQPEKLVEAGVGRRVRTVGSERESGTRTEHVAVGVTRASGWLER